VDRKIESRLKREPVIWLVTTGKDLHPQAVPVWFLWEDSSFLIYAQDGVKVRHIRENPNIELHLNTDESGDIVVRASGRATLARSPAAHTVPDFVRKYGSQIKGFGWTPEEFARRYPNVIRVKKPRFH
jgi:PPOX class probable F420-dependent enzyme